LVAAFRRLEYRLRAAYEIYIHKQSTHRPYKDLVCIDEGEVFSKMPTQCSIAAKEMVVGVPTGFEALQSPWKMWKAGWANIVPG